MFSVGSIMGSIKLDIRQFLNPAKQVINEAKNLKGAVRDIKGKVGLDATQFKRDANAVLQEHKRLKSQISEVRSHVILDTKKWKQEQGILKNDSNAITNSLLGMNAALGRSGSLAGLTGSSLMKLGVAGASIAGIGFAVYKLAGFLKDASVAAIQFESAFTGVRKTVDATEQEFGAFRKEILNLSKTMPIDTTSLSRLAEAGGQLGITNDALMKFTQTMAMIGTATNMAGDQAATALARWANITQLAQSDIDRLGASIVELGNNFATTESEIVDLGLRLAGVGSQIGLTDSDIAALAASLSSVGLEIEAAGTAMSRIMADIKNAVETGAPEINLFAALIGETKEEFQNLFRANPREGLMRIVESLDEFKEAGGNVFEVLEKLGMEDVRTRDALLRISKASDTLSNAMTLSAVAWKENSALTDEANKRFATTESKLEILKNKYSAIKIEIAERFTPAVNSMIDALSGAIDKLAGLEKQMTGFAGTTEQLRRFSEEMRMLGGITGPVMPKVPPLSTERASALEGALDTAGIVSATDKLRAMVMAAQDVNTSVEDIAKDMTKGNLLAAGVLSMKNLSKEAGMSAEQVSGVNAAMEKLGGSADKAAKEAASAFERLKEEAANLRLEVFPQEALNADLRRVAELATKFPDLMDDAAVSAKFGKLWEEFRDKGEDAAIALGPTLASLPEHYRNAFMQAQADVEARLKSEAFDELLQTISPTASFVKEATAQIKTLVDAGHVNDDPANLLGEHLWNQLRDVSTAALQEILNQLALVNGGLETADRILTAREAEKEVESIGRGTEIADRVSGATQLNEIKQALLDVKAAGRLDEGMESLLATDYWQQMESLGTDAIDAIIDAVRPLAPTFASELEDAKRSMERFKKASKFSELAGQISSIGDAVGNLGPEFAGAAKAAKIAAAIMNVAAAVISGNWFDIAMSILEAVDALGIFGGKNEEEAKGMEKLMEDIGDAVDQWAQQMSDAIAEFVVEGEKNFKDLAKTITKELLSLTITDLVLQPAIDWVGGKLFAKGGAFDAHGNEITPFAKGAAFDYPNVVPFASGGHVTRGKEFFPMAGGRTGLRGEAGPEAVLPLERMADGRLGVLANASFDFSPMIARLDFIGQMLQLVRSELQGIGGRLQYTADNAPTMQERFGESDIPWGKIALALGAVALLLTKTNLIPNLQGIALMNGRMMMKQPIFASASTPETMLALPWRRTGKPTVGDRFENLELGSLLGGLGRDRRDRGVTVNVQAKGVSEDQIQVVERRGPDGEQILDIIVNAVKQGLGRGEFDRDLALNFGVRRGAR